MAKWHDISAEEHRTYKYGDGSEITIYRPRSLAVKRGNGGRDSHRLVSENPDGKKKAHYIAPGWLAIEWTVKKDKPLFVESLVDGPIT